MKKLYNYKNFLNKMNESVNYSNLLNNIDYTLLKPEANENDIIELCRKADILGVKSVCVLPKMVKIASEELKDSDVLVCTVISFPHGTDSTRDKLSEIRMAINNNADECDMVINVPKLKDTENDNFDEIVFDIQTLADECHKHTNKNGDDIILKVIVESGLLNEDETRIATETCLKAGADYIKTSTGFANCPGAELDKIIIMKKVIDDNNEKMKIKASGGIRNMSDLQKFSPYVDRFGVGFSAVDSIFSNILNTNTNININNTDESY